MIQTPRRTNCRTDAPNLAALVADSRRHFPTFGGGLLIFALLLFLTVKLITGPGIYGPAVEKGFLPDAESATAFSELSSGFEQTTSESLPDRISVPAAQEKQTVIEMWMEPLELLQAALTDSDVFTICPPDPADRIPDRSVTVLALGDNLMHNTVMWSGQIGEGYDFRPLYQYIRDEVQAADIACINQETIFINDPEQFTNYPSFGGPTQIGEALIDTGFDVILHATNHCYDKFSAGIRDTLNFWHQHPEITVLGIHDSQEDADTIRVVENNGIRIAMLNYTYGTNVGGVEQSYMVDYLDSEEKISEDIRRAKEISDFVLVFPHWGTENTFEPDTYQRKWAQFFADQGVGAVIGGHPHTLQPVEVLTGASGNTMPVYWSLGNFISDMAANWNMLGGMALLTVSQDSFGTYVSDYQLIPTMTYDSHAYGVWQFYGMLLEDYNDVLAATHRREGTSVQEMWDLYHRIIPNSTQE